MEEHLPKTGKPFLIEMLTKLKSNDSSKKDSTEFDIQLTLHNAKQEENKKFNVNSSKDSKYSKNNLSPTKSMYDKLIKDYEALQAKLSSIESEQRIIPNYIEKKDRFDYVLKALDETNLHLKNTLLNENVFVNEHENRKESENENINIQQENNKLGKTSQDNRITILINKLEASKKILEKEIIEFNLDSNNPSPIPKKHSINISNNLNFEKIKLHLLQKSEDPKELEKIALINAVSGRICK